MSSIPSRCSAARELPGRRNGLPVWDWGAIPDLYSGKAKYTGMNVQIACNLKGDVAAIGRFPCTAHGTMRTRSRPPASRKYWSKP